MKETKPYTSEVAYDCPYCGNTQGWSDCIDEEDYEMLHNCNKCKKRFKLTKEQ